MTAWSCPVPFEGETLFSIIARVYLRGAFKSPLQVLARVGVNRSQHLITPFGGSYLSILFEAFPELMSVLTMEDAVWLHTTSPLLQAFSEGCNNPGRRATFTKSVAERGGWHGAPRSSFLLCPEGLRFCVECGVQDLQEVGVSYWHREHQVKIVTRCWRHGTRLKELRKSIGTGYPLDVPPMSMQAELAEEVAIGDPSMEGIGTQVALAISRVLSSSECAEPQRVQRLFFEAAHKEGLLHRRSPAYKRIWKLMEDVYGKSFLAALGMPTDYSRGAVKRFAAPFRASSKRLDPAIIVMMAVALKINIDEICKASDSIDPLTDNLQNKPDGVSIEEEVIDIELENALKSNGYILNRVKLALGITRQQLIMRIIAARITCPIIQGVTAKHSESEIRAMMELVRSGVPREKLQEQFSCSNSIIDQLHIYDPSLRQAAKLSRFEAIKKQNRDAVLQLIKEIPGLTRAQLRNSLPGPVSHLDRNDREWLSARLSGLPIVRHRFRSKKAGRGRVDDKILDCETCAKVEAVKQEAFDLVPPRRVTARMLFSLAKIPEAIFSKLSADRLPMTAMLLEKMLETQEAYDHRKLRYALQQVAMSRNTVTATSLRLASGFTPEKLARYREFVHQEAQKMQTPFSSRAAKWIG